MRARQVIAATGIAVLILVGSGCGDDTGPAADTTQEPVDQEDGGADADFDVDSGKVKVPDGEGGTFEVGEDGNVEVTDDDGSTQVASGDDATLPEGWPAALALPAGSEILYATTSTEAGRELLSVSAQLSGSMADAAEAFRSQLTAAGYELAPEAAGPGTGSANVVASDDATNVVASFSTDAASATMATISVTPAS